MDLPRDPDFAEYADVVLDLYMGSYKGEPLGERDFVLSGDEKPGLLLRTRCCPIVLPSPGKPGLKEFEYRLRNRCVACADGYRVRTRAPRDSAKERHSSFLALIKKLLEQEKYRSATRLFFVIDNGSSHARNKIQERLN